MRESLERRGNLDVIDEKAMLENSDFPIGTDELVRKTKLFIENKYGAEDKSTLDAKFEFIGPFVGPLNRLIHKLDMQSHQLYFQYQLQISCLHQRQQ